MIRGPEVGERQLEVLRGGDPLRLGWVAHSGKLGEIEGLPLGIHFRKVILGKACPEVVGVRQGVPDLFQLAQSDFPRLVEALDDVTGDLVGDLALFTRSVQPSFMDVVLAVLARLLDALPSHVRACVLPHRVETGPVGKGSVTLEVHAMTELPTGDQSSPSWSFGTILEWRWSGFSFVRGDCSRKCDLSNIPVFLAPEI